MYRGVYTAPPNAAEGIQLVYLTDRQAIRVDGWCGQQRMQAVDIPLGEFLGSLGITAEQCRQVLGQSQTTFAGEQLQNQSASQGQVPVPPAQGPFGQPQTPARAAAEAVPRTEAVPSAAPRAR